MKPSRKWYTECLEDFMPSDEHLNYLQLMYTLILFECKGMFLEYGWENSDLFPHLSLANFNDPLTDWIRMCCADIG